MSKLGHGDDGSSGRHAGVCVVCLMRMSRRKLGHKAVALAALVLVVVPHIVDAQEPSLSNVLARAAAYVADFQHQLSGIVADQHQIAVEVVREQVGPQGTLGQ